MNQALGPGHAVHLLEVPHLLSHFWTVSCVLGVAGFGESIDPGQGVLSASLR
jgi:hypothetical protein